jgi:hypothetical protein
MTIRWYLGGIAAGAAIGSFAAGCHLSGWAPVGLVSLGVGVALGYVLSKLSAASGIGCPRRLAVGALIFALVAVFAEHTWLYHDFRRQWQAARASDPQVALFRPAEPWTPAEYFRHEISSGRVALWCVDAVLIVAGAVGVVLVRRGANTKKLVVADDANGLPDH